MNPIEKIFDYVEGQPKVVAVTLLGVIVVGAIGGGFLISNLQTTIQCKDGLIAEMEKLNKERSKLQQDRHKSALQLAKQENITLSEELVELNKGASSFSATVDKIIAKLNSAIETGGLNDAGRQTILDTIIIIQNQSNEMEQAINRAETVSNFARSLERSMRLSAEFSMEKHRISEVSFIGDRWIKVIIILSIILNITLFLWWILIRRERKLKQKIEGEAQQHHSHGGS
jgi:hypothetical protein